MKKRKTIILGLCSVIIIFIIIPLSLQEYAKNLLSKDECYRSEQRKNIPAPQKTTYTAIKILKVVKYFPGFNKRSADLVSLVEQRCINSLVSDQISLQIISQKNAQEIATKKNNELDSRSRINAIKIENWRDGCTPQMKNEFCYKWKEFAEFMQTEGISISQFTDICKP